MEFLVHIEITGPVQGDAEKRESVRAAELARAGTLVRLWRVPGQWANWGIWRAKDLGELHEILASLPLFPYMKLRVEPLVEHPHDPARRPREERGLPGLRGGDHFGVTVPDLEAATRFFCDVIGCTAFYDVGPIASDTDWMQTHLNVHPRARVERLRFLRCGNGLNIELFEYTSPDQRTEMPKNSDYGGHHLALYVDDFDRALGYLKEKGVRILGEPTVRTEGPNAGVTWIYFLTPWGMQMELLSYPSGKGYEAMRPDRLWHPAYPDR